MSDTAVALARRAYETVEPFHVVAYFNPGINDALRDLGIDPQSFYVGARAAPIGEANA
ncbi:helix-turn-helix domain-containing protein, partial [Tsukamurella strandjordii]